MKLKARLNKLIPLFLFLLGSGVVWQVQQARVANRSHELAQTVAIADLRAKITDLAFHIIQLTNEYVQTRDAHDREPMESSYAKVEELKCKLALLKDDHQILEQKLAGMENREPRKLELDFSSLKPLKPPRMKPIVPFQRSN